MPVRVLTAINTGWVDVDSFHFSLFEEEWTVKVGKREKKNSKSTQISMSYRLEQYWISKTSNKPCYWIEKIPTSRGFFFLEIFLMAGSIVKLLNHWSLIRLMRLTYFSKNISDSFLSFWTPEILSSNRIVQIDAVNKIIHNHKQYNFRSVTYFQDIFTERIYLISRCESTKPWNFSV